VVEKNLNLWQIGTEYQSLLSKLYDVETGEVNEEIDNKLTQVAATAEKKCLAVATYIQKMESEIREVAYLKEQLAKREAAYHAEVERLHHYLKTNMERTKIKEISCPYFSIKLKVNPYGTDILDEKMIPEKFMRTREIIKKETKPDRIAIKEEVLKTGQQIPGAYVSQKTQVKISIDKI
jgi:hypothetical protein